MSNNYRNNEGYPDPTADEALSRITANEKQSLRAFRPIVYICSPYSGGIDANVAAARRYCRFAVEQGYIPIAPHLLFPQFLDDNRSDERELGLFFGNALMKSTDHLKMPELISTQYEVALSDAERDRYENLKQELILQLPDGEITAAKVGLGNASVTARSPLNIVMDSLLV